MRVLGTAKRPAARQPAEQPSRRRPRAAESTSQGPVAQPESTRAGRQQDGPAYLRTGVRRRRKWADRLGYYEPMPTPIPSTTRQAEALRVGVACRSGSERALGVGFDVSTGEPVFSDPVSDYAMEDGPTNPCRIRIGDVGSGKSSDIKCNGILRPLLLGRRVATIDIKDQGGRHEYAPVCGLLGVNPVRFATDGSGVRINALDPRISMAGGAAGRGAGQTELLRGILHELMGGPLSERQGKATRMAHRQAVGHAGNQHRTADIRDLVPALLAPDASAAARAGVSAAELREWGLDVAFALERCIEEDLVGLVDGPTDPSVELNYTFTCFDLSSLPEAGPAIPVVMAIINTWLTNTLKRQGQLRVPTHFNVEEAWHLASGSFGDVALRNTKLVRGTGLISEFALHHLSDVNPASPAMAMVREAGHVKIYKQDKEDDIRACTQTFNLPPELAGLLGSLNKGTHVQWQSGRRPRLVQHLRSDIEADITNTDDVLLSKATTFDLVELLSAAEDQTLA